MFINRFSSLTSALVLGLALAFGAPALAQTTATEDTATETTEGTGASQGDGTVESQLSMGEDADQPSQLGQAYIQETIGAFELRCLRTENPDNDPCQMYQLVADDQGVPVAEFSLFRLPDGGQAEAGATVIVPLETALPEQLTLSIDSGPARRYPFQFCNSLGCYARIGLTTEEVTQFKRGNTASLIIVPALAPDQKVTLALSLSGFTATYDKVSVIDQ